MVLSLPPITAHNASDRSAHLSPPHTATLISASRSALSSPSPPTTHLASRSALTRPPSPSTQNMNMALPLQSNPRSNTTPKYSLYTPCPLHLRPHSSLQPNNWKILLEGYPDPEYVNNIVGIATHGARIGYRGPLRQIYNPNHTSATRIHQEINDNIKQELENGRITKIDSLPPAFISSPLGAVQKKQKGAHTGWRRINDLSYPQGFSVNDGIPTEFSSLKYQQHRRDLHVYTDASDAKGIGAWHGSNAFAIRMPRRHKVKHINWKEAYAVLFSIAKWGQSRVGSGRAGRASGRAARNFGRNLGPKFGPRPKN